MASVFLTVHVHNSTQQVLSTIDLPLALQALELLSMNLSNRLSDVLAIVRKSYQRLSFHVLLLDALPIIEGRLIMRQ